MLVERAKADSFAQKPTKDIGEPGYNRDVYHFVREDTNVQPTPWPRKETPFDYNGSDPKSHAQKPMRDIGEGGIDPEVHGMASSNNMVLPIPHARRDTPYLPNGSDPKSHFIGVRFMKPTRDIGEGGIDPEVHGMASSNNMVLPIPHARRDTPYLPNGSDPKSHFMARPSRDVGETGLNPTVHGFVKGVDVVLP